MQLIWVELPAKDIERARDFYQAVFDIEAEDVSTDTVEGQRRISRLAGSGEPGNPGISLTETENFTPRTGGTLVYLNAGDQLAAYLQRVRDAGGTVTREKTSMGQGMYYATFEDTEGNELAFFSYMGE